MSDFSQERRWHDDPQDPGRAGPPQGQGGPAGPAAARPAARASAARPQRLDLRADHPVPRGDRPHRARFGLDTYPNQLEIITAEQMMDAYASVGMPVNYRHWSYGKEFIATEKNYKRGQMGLAYEIVINSNPCISYLMEENTMAMQALVIAHAAYGHNSFFKGNYLFRMWTDASSIIDYLVYAKNYVASARSATAWTRWRSSRLLPRAAEPRRGPLPPPDQEVAGRGAGAAQGPRGLCPAAGQRPVAHPAAQGRGRRGGPEARRFPAEPEENLLYFIEKNAPLLEPWQREIVRIVRKMAQYFYPQRQTQVMNEGWATFWHHKLLNTMYDDGYLTDGVMIEWLKSHTNVIYQPRWATAATTASTPTRWALRCTPTSSASASAHRRGPRLVPRHRRQALAAHAGPGHAQLQGRELHRPVPQPQADARLPPVRHQRRRPPAHAGGQRHPRRGRLPPGARGSRASTTWARASPTSRSGTSTCAATAA
jgi:stage V sporulation protein R